MRITRLQLAGLRAFEQAEFDFNPGMNLLVGVNGVGKTTVLDALRICLSRIFPAVTASRSPQLAFANDDIRIGADAATVRLFFKLNAQEFEFVVHKKRSGSVPHRAGEVREQALETPDKETCTPELSAVGEHAKRTGKQPLGLFFSTRRSLVSADAPSKTSAKGGQTAAFADALSFRGLRLAELAYWMRAQESLGHEHPIALKHLAALRRAARKFLPDCKNLRAEGTPRPRLIVQKGKATLDVRQLSDGERGMLALALDLARRLSQANPGLADPLTSGQAVVLIDELELHLHPKWQRTIVEQLTKTFPKCQFIGTTHSPQVIGEVPKEWISIIDDDMVYSPARSFGVDSSRVLEEVMDAPSRNVGTEEELATVARAIDDEDFKKASRVLEHLEKKVGEDDPEVTRARALMHFLQEGS